MDSSVSVNIFILLATRTTLAHVRLFSCQTLQAYFLTTFYLNEIVLLGWPSRQNKYCCQGSFWWYEKKVVSWNFANR